jgi:hypothetical protein
MCPHTPSQKVRQAPDRAGAFFVQPDTSVISIANLSLAEYDPDWV